MRNRATLVTTASYVPHIASPTVNGGPPPGVERTAPTHCNEIALSVMVVRGHTYVHFVVWSWTLLHRLREDIMPLGKAVVRQICVQHVKYRVGTI